MFYYIKNRTKELMKVISAIGSFPERRIKNRPERLSITDMEQRFVIDLLCLWYRSWPGRHKFHLLIY